MILEDCNDDVYVGTSLKCKDDARSAELSMHNFVKSSVIKIPLWQYIEKLA